jgi:hypothetical protein
MGGSAPQPLGSRPSHIFAKKRPRTRRGQLYPRKLDTAGRRRPQRSYRGLLASSMAPLGTRSPPRTSETSSPWQARAERPGPPRHVFAFTLETDALAPSRRAKSLSSFGIGAEPGHQEHRRPSTSVPTEARGWRSTVRRSIARLVPQPGQKTSSHGVPATRAARIVGDQSMSRPVARRRFQQSMTSSASRRAAQVRLQLGGASLDVESSCPDARLRPSESIRPMPSDGRPDLARVAPTAPEVVSRPG